MIYKWPVAHGQEKDRQQGSRTNAEPISKMRRTANLLRRLGIVSGHLESTNRAHTPRARGSQMNL